ncbi:MAG TPA: hypothetical protein VNO70_02225 [Blastocatellia bacterium]|nr:hypothetical protein [Blastocatellia bacterium]
MEHDAERGFILMRAEVYRNADDALPAATGHAFEVRSEGYVNKTSYIENAETSSVGRALALCGFEVRRGIASREDMERTTRRQEPPREKARPQRPEPVEASAKTDQAATEEQKQSILKLLENLRPGDRKAQQRLFVELTGKESRDDLAQQEAASLINRLRQEASEGSI